MRTTYPVIWALHGQMLTGKLEVSEERVELSARGYTFAFARRAVERFVVERGAEARIRGLTAITVSLDGGEVVRVASLGGAGSMHEIATLLGPAEKGRVGGQELAGTST